MSLKTYIGMHTPVLMTSSEWRRNYFRIGVLVQMKVFTIRCCAVRPRWQWWLRVEPELRPSRLRGPPRLRLRQRLRQRIRSRQAVRLRLRLGQRLRQRLGLRQALRSCLWWLSAYLRHAFRQRLTMTVILRLRLAVLLRLRLAVLLRPSAWRGYRCSALRRRWPRRRRRPPLRRRPALWRRGRCRSA